MKGKANGTKVAHATQKKVGPKPQANDSKARTGASRGAKGVQPRAKSQPSKDTSDATAKGRATAEAVSSEKVIPFEYVQTIESKSLTRIIIGALAVMFLLGLFIGMQL